MRKIRIEATVDFAIVETMHGYGGSALSLKILVGDCRETLKSLPDESVHCVVTSPPYFGLRNYGEQSRQIGLEDKPQEFVDALVEVFGEIHRVLRPDGTVWLNLGDTYGKRKNILGMPWRVAFALQDFGWILRQDIIWHKPNPVPESVKDRCTRAHEYIFLLTKAQKYFFDNAAIKEIAVSGATIRDKAGEGYQADYAKGDRFSKGVRVYGADGLRNKRDVWSVSVRSYPGAHFATFPPQLIEPCVLAGCPEGGVVLDPFGGSGTTAGVALAHGRLAILCELNPDYAELITGRVEQIGKIMGTQIPATSKRTA